jgi:hypothetical protein
MRSLISPPWRIFFGSLFSMLSLAGLVGNLLVIVAILGDRKMRKSVMNLLLLNLVHFLAFCFPKKLNSLKSSFHPITIILPKQLTSLRPLPMPSTW